MTQAELEKLLHAFTADPSPALLRPLAEAYLSMGRLVEAMVVCKKGVKANPQVAEPRVLLARVYAALNKDKKALEELQGALQVTPQDPQALRMAGALHMKLGEVEPGKALLQQAFQADPSNAETQELVKQWNVPVTAVRRQASMPASPEQHSAKPASFSPPPPPPEALRTPGHAPTGEVAPHRSSAASVPQRNSARTASVYEEVVSQFGEFVPERQRGSGRGKMLAFFMAVMAPVALGAYFYIGKRQAETSREVKKHLAEAGKFMRRDTLAAYDKAIEAAEAARDLDTRAPAANGYLAYIYAIRYGEFGGDETIRTLAEKYLKAAFNNKNPSSDALAAQALLQSYAGKGNDALSGLQKQVQQMENENRRNAHLYATLGVLRMNAGDMDGAKKALDQALFISSDDARIHALMGTLYQRRGQVPEAWNSYDAALRVEPAHADSILGKLYLRLDLDSPDRQYIEASKDLTALLEGSATLSPRHKGMALMLKSLLVSRVGNDLELYQDKDFVKQLSVATGVVADKGRVVEAVRSAEEAAFREYRNNPDLYFVQGRRKFYEQDFQGAAEAFRKAISMDGVRAHYHVELARALMEKKGGEKEAEMAVRKALTLIPSSPKLLVLLGHTLAAQKKMDQALAQYESSVKDVETKNPEARLALGRLYREFKKDFQQSLAQLEMAAKEYSGESLMQARAYMEIGLTQEALGDASGAKESYVKALKLDANFPEPYFYVARLLSTDTHEKSRVKELAAKYLELSPEGAFAKAAKELR